MKNRKLKTADGQTITTNDSDWRAVVNVKKFDEKETEILRVTYHNTRQLFRVYAMRSVDGKIVAEQNDIVVGDDFKPAAAKAMASVGMTKISASDF